MAPDGDDVSGGSFDSYGSRSEETIVFAKRVVMVRGLIVADVLVKFLLRNAVDMS